MFITTQGFKKLIGKAYKGVGLKVGNDREGIFLSGGYWVIWIKKGEIPKKELAAIIELTGELPKEGEIFEATKSGNQYEIPDIGFYHAMDHADACEKFIEITPIIIKEKDASRPWRVLQDPNNNHIEIIQEQFIEMIDNTVIDYDGGETQAEGPLYDPSGIFWNNNAMALHVMPGKWDKMKNLIDFLEGTNIAAEAEE